MLLDGEGLGHTPKSGAAIPTSLTRRIQATDAVVLVDSAMQPMQAAPVTAMRELISSGNARKLLIVFTHFDQVRGDNLPTISARENHVLASAENVLASIGEELGNSAERALRARLQSARYFVGGIDKPLDSTKIRAQRTVAQLDSLLTAIHEMVKQPVPAAARPIYDRMNLVLAVKSAAETFQNSWLPLLGLSINPGVAKEHWTRVRALSRRLGTPTMEDQYDTLRPVADLHQQLQARVYKLLQSPLAWTATEPEDTDKQQIFDTLAERISAQLLEISTRRIRTERFPDWQQAYAVAGRGSSFTRAHIISNHIYQRAAPIPDVTPSIDRNSFLHDVARVVEDVCVDFKAQLK